MVRRFFLFLSASLVVSFLPFFPHKSIPQNNVPAESIPAEPQFEDLTLERVFKGDHSLPAGVSPDDIRTVIVTGDVIPARGVNIETAKKNDFIYPWRETISLLQGDLLVIDLEAPIMKNCPILGTGFTFCGSSRHIEGLEFAGVDLASLENNHITNFGMTGVNETIGFLESKGIAWGRRDHLGVKEVRGVKFGLLAYNGIGERVDRDQMVAQIKESKPEVDVLMVMYHWGKEYERLPLTDGNIAPDDPQELAHLAVDAGADLVLGNHPHWVQAVEIYNDHFIPYGHGNFIFDQMWSEETRLGVVGKYTYYKTKLVDVQFFPTKIFAYAQPRPLVGEEAQSVLDKMYQGSQELTSLTSGGQSP